MSGRTSRSFMSRLGEGLSFTSYIEASSYRSLNDCIDRLRNYQGKRVWLGGHLTRFVRAKSNAPHQVRFQIEYYRLRESNAAPSPMMQLLTAAMYEENGETHLIGKVHFTGSALFWLWLGIALNLVPVFLFLYGNAIGAAIVLLTGPFLLVLCVMMWFERKQLVGIVRDCMRE